MFVKYTMMKPTILCDYYYMLIIKPVLKTKAKSFLPNPK